jgi:hypothetical protein
LEVHNNFQNNILFPNPSKGSITMESSLLNNLYVNIEIFDLLANKVYSNYVKADSNRIQIDNTSYLMNGTYLIRIIDTKTNSLIISETFIINH